MTAPDTTQPGIADLEAILESFRERHPGASSHPIRDAYRLAAELHDGQLRKSGEPFVTHPLAVARMLAEYGLDSDTIVAAILHDVVEDTDVGVEDIAHQFGPEVAALIDGVTKLDRIRFRDRQEQQAASIRKLVVAMAEDVRVLLLKLADRLHNVRTLDALAPEKQQRIARETLEVYAPLAHRLGVQEMKHEMEDRSFAVLYPKRYAELAELVASRTPAREAYLARAVSAVESSMADAGVKGEVTGRPKHLYSIYRKMVASGRPFGDVHDLVGIRVLTDDVKDCYAVLGLVHAMWVPVHGRFKDYIATPKFNLYQSLHTTVVGPDGKPLEVQIRTHDMHARAEFGVAAHWRYKEGGHSPELSWMTDMQFLQETYTDPGEFLAGLKIDLYRDEVLALTPQGDVLTLPRGATTIDFAYAIHTEVGHHCVGAKVNGRLVPLSTELGSGDIVEIMTSRSPDAGPSRDWLRFAATSRAAAKIRQWFNRERRQEALAAGKDQVARAIAREGLGLPASERDRLLTSVAATLGYSSLEQLQVSVGEGNVSAQTVATRVARLVRPVDYEDRDQGGDLLLPPRPKVRRPSAGVMVEGQSDVLVRIAGCCAPVPGDEIVGFVTIGRGVSVHRADCTNLAALSGHDERMIDVDWSPDRVGTFAVWLQVEGLDRPGLLRDVTSALSDVGANIQASSSGTDDDLVAVLRYEVELSDPGQLPQVIAGLKRIEGVYDAYRLVPQAGA